MKITKTLRKQMIEHDKNNHLSILIREDELWSKFVKIYKEVSDFSKKNQSHSRLLNIILSEVLKNIKVTNKTTDIIYLGSKWRHMKTLNSDAKIFKDC